MTPTVPFQAWIRELKEDGLGTMQSEFVKAIETRFFASDGILENKIYVLSTLLDPRLVIVAAM